MQWHILDHTGVNVLCGFNITLTQRSSFWAIFLRVMEDRKDNLL